MKIKNKIKTCIAITFAALLFGCSGEPKLDTIHGPQKLEKSKQEIIASLKGEPEKLRDFLHAFRYLGPSKDENGMTADQLIENFNKITRENNEKTNNILKKYVKKTKKLEKNIIYQNIKILNYKKDQKIHHDHFQLASFEKIWRAAKRTSG